MTIENGGKGWRLRPEGRVLDWDQLTDDQKKVVVDILTALHEAVTEKYAENRRSQVYFIHGARGTGKSSVIVSLLKELETARWENAKKDVAQRLAGLRDKVIGLEMLDMDPLPPSTHLMSAVLARIEHVAVRQRQTKAGGSDVDDPLFRFRRAQIAAVEGWEANVREKAPNTDLEVFAGDVVRAERRKIELLPELNRQVDELCKRVLGKPDALFVLPVDDFDLNPARAVELIKLVRTLALPRLFTLILGDIDVARHVFYLSTRGDLVQAGRLEARAQTQDTDLVAGETAAAAIRKLIPPEQVLRLELIRTKKALRHTPFTGQDNLGKLLHQVHVKLVLPGYDPKAKIALTTTPEGPVSRSLLGILTDLSIDDLAPPAGAQGQPAAPKPDTDAPGQGGISSVPAAGFPYPGAEILRASARHLTDLWMALSNIASRNESERQRALVEFAVRLYRQAIDEDPALTAEDRRICQSAIHLNESSDEWEIDTAHFEIRSRFGTPLELRVREGLDIVAHRIVRWEVRVRHGDLLAGRKAKLSHEMAERTVGALCLLHDLLLFGDQGSVPETVSDAAMARRTCARWSLGGMPLEVPWFLDVWSTFWETSLFIDTWNKVKRRAREFASGKGWMTLDDVAMYLRFGWVLAGLWVLSPDRGVNEEEPERPNATLEDLRRDYLDGDLNALKWKDQAESPLQVTILKAIEMAIEKLANRVFKHLKEGEYDRITNERIRWFITLGCLFTPECGCLLPMDGSGGRDVWGAAVRSIHNILVDKSTAQDGGKDWQVQITSRIVEERVRRLFRHTPWDPSLVWFLNSELAKKIKDQDAIEAPLREDEPPISPVQNSQDSNRECFSLFDKQPANRDCYKAMLRRALVQACLRTPHDAGAKKVQDALRPNPDPKKPASAAKEPSATKKRAQAAKKSSATKKRAQATSTRS